MELIMNELPQMVDELSEHIELLDENLLQIEKGKGGPDILDSLYRSFHTIKGSSAFLGLRAIEILSHKNEYLLDKAKEGSIELKGKPLDVLFDVVDALKKILESLANAIKSGSAEIKLPEFPELISAIDSLINVTDHTAKTRPETEFSEGDAEDEAPVVAQQQKLVSSLSSGLSSRVSPPSLSPMEPQQVELPDENGSPELEADKQKKIMLKETVKVDSERLDRLVDMIGELVIAETMVTQSSEVKKINSPQIIQNISHLDKITRELQAMGTSLRMVPIHSTFQKMARLVRDLSKKIGKDIEFNMRGEDTELDKTVVDRIGDPLVHMVRNAVDHGIEDSSEDRTAAGKQPKGKIYLRAFHKGGNIYIEVEDDGRGLDKKAIVKKAKERGLIASEDDHLSDKDIYSLILMPGFSTAKKITEISGRGVGMDVVKKNIEALRGQIDIQSEQGIGSIFSIRLPLTLAIIDGMVVSVNSERYIIPTLSIVMSVSVPRDEIKTVQNRGEMLSLQGELIPVFHMDRIFQHIQREDKSENLLIVVVEDAGQKTGIFIDELLGQQQIVIKSLGDYLKGIPGISGGAIMPDGNVGLILDIGGIVRLANL